MSGPSCDSLRLLKPAALGGPSPNGMAVAAPVAVSYGIRSAGGIALLVLLFAFVVLALLFYFSSWNWTRVQTPDGQVTTEPNLGAVLGAAFLLALLLAIIVYFAMRNYY